MTILWECTLANVGPLLAATNVVDYCLADGVARRVAFVAHRGQGIPVALLGALENLVPVG
jgi:hypothetical protein